MHETSPIRELGSWVQDKRRAIVTLGITAVLAMGSLVDITEANTDGPPSIDTNTPTLLTKLPVAPQQNESNQVTGVEITTEDSLYITIAQPEDTIILVQQNEKTDFIALKRAGEKNARICGNASKWELNKFNVNLQPSDTPNACTTLDMNAEKNRFNIGFDFNGMHKVDGTFGTPTDLFDSRCTDPTLYREYGTSTQTPINKDPKSEHGFEYPLILDDGTKATLPENIHYRFTERTDGIAANIRIDPQDIAGLTVTEQSQMNKWFWVRRVCLPDNIEMNGPEKPDNAVRGKHPISAAPDA